MTVWNDKFHLNGPVESFNYTIDSWKDQLREQTKYILFLFILIHIYCLGCNTSYLVFDRKDCFF